MRKMTLVLLMLFAVPAFAEVNGRACREAS